MNLKRDSLPRRGKAVLWLVLKDEDYYQTIGDFEESYRYRIKTENRAKALFWFWAMLSKSMPQFMKDFHSANPDSEEELVLQPIRNIHLHSKLVQEIAPNSDIVYVYIFSAAAFLILIIAGVNFVNLSTSQSFFISGFQPVSSIKGVRDPRSTAKLLRNGLVIFQFIISISMIFCTITFYRQLLFLHNQDLGFDKDRLIAVRMYADFKEVSVGRMEAIKNEILRHSAVSQVVLTSNLFGTAYSNERLTPVSVEDKSILPLLRFIRVDDDFIETAGLELVEPFVLEYRPTSTNFVLVKVQGDSFQDVLTYIEGKFDEIMPGHEQVAAEFCLSRRDQHLDFYAVRPDGPPDSSGHYQLPGRKSGRFQSNRQSEV